MSEQGVETTLGTYALHAEPFFAGRCGYRPGDLPNSYRALPALAHPALYPPMDEADLERITRALHRTIHPAKPAHAKPTRRDVGVAP